MNNQLQKLLVIGDGVTATGFSRVLTSITEHLRKKYDVHHFALSYTGDPFEPYENYHVYPNNLKGDGFGLHQLPEVFAKVKPDIVLALNDAWYMPMLKQLVDPYKPGLKVVVYAAIDNARIKPNDFNKLECIDRYVVFTEFAKKTIEDYFRGRETFIPQISVIPHGFDAARFYPMEAGRDQSKTAARKLLFPHRPEIHNSFIVLNANKNQLRKRIDLTIEGFALFARNKPDVYLHLHMGLKYMHYDIMELVNRAGIEHRVLFTREGDLHPDVTDEELNTLYNASDVGLNTSNAEGWGLVSFEHAATGVAQVVPAHSACNEIWTGSAVMMETVKWEGDDAVLNDVTPEAVASALEKLYTDRDLLLKTGEACLNMVSAKKFQWEHIASAFDELMQAL